MAVSVVIPALDMEATLRATLGSLVAQTFERWEAIVVDDGSIDGTAGVAREWAARDDRINVLERAHAGASASRNAGIVAARHPLLLFLDADDALVPTCLERLVERLERDPDLVGAYGSWARVAGDGRRVTLTPSAGNGDLFPEFARYCVFAIHTCLVRRQAVEEAGLFDPGLTTCEDWDLWQRIARTGGRFVHVPEIVALYNLNERSASRDLHQLLADGLVVSRRGHAADPRVRRPHPGHAAGAPREELADAQVVFVSWVVGHALGDGTESTDLLEGLPRGPIPNLDPERIGLTLFETVFRQRCPHPDLALEAWPAIEGVVRRFLDALERRAAASGLALRARRALERRMLAEYPRPRPVTVGGSHAVAVSLVEPISDLECPVGTDRAVVSLMVGGYRLGTVELPVFDGRVAADVIADIDDDLAWRMLGLLFGEAVYAELDLRLEEDGFAVRRGGVVLARGLTADQAAMPALHDHVGWTVFLQELWGLPERGGEAFYEPAAPRPDDVARSVAAQPVVVDVVDALEALATDETTLVVDLRVGGAAVGLVAVPVSDGVVSAEELLTALTTEGGLELCRVAVREGIVGRELDGASLRRRLDEARRRLEDDDGSSPAERATLGRHPAAPLGTSGSRRALLPPVALSEIRELAALTGQPLVERPGSHDAPILYAPGLLGHAVAAIGAEARVPRAPAETPAVVAYGRHHFEELLAAEPDPWRYESAYERRKYEQTLSLVPPRAPRALEIGCAEGHFTVALAARVGELVAVDLSEIALARARARCAGLANVQFTQLDVANDPLPGRFDLVVCSELLYYLGHEGLQDVARKLAEALVPGGALVLAHANLQVDEPDEPGYDWALPYGARHIGDVLSAEPALRFTKELRTPLYRVQLFHRRQTRGLARLRFRGSGPGTVEHVPYDEPIPEVLETFHWERASVAAAADAAVETWHLPILMYHRVASTGAEATARWRVAPDDFERQIAYLADAGFRSVSLEEWRRAARLRRPLPGRAVVLTFDDAYEDFATHAWPVLERYGLGAAVFLVSGHVGGTAVWDAGYGESAPLLDWGAVRELAGRGVEFGSHSVSHAPLTQLSVDDIALECLRSRVAIEGELGRPITALSYPHGAHDPVVEHLAGAAGYVFGLSCRAGAARFGDPPLALPRQEIMGSTSFEQFVSALA